MIVLLVMPPEKPDTPSTRMPLKAVAEIVPLLLMPPAKVCVSRVGAFAPTNMPLPLADEIVPLLAIPPDTVALLVTVMPLAVV